MLKAKGGLTSKPSKASLKSRGLHPNTALRLWNEGTKSSSLDGCFSLYSTDSEDNVAGVNKGLDKCAELLTNILEIKDTQRQHGQPILPNTKKQKCDPSSKSSNKEKSSQKLKRKSRTGVHIPRKSGQSNVQAPKLRPAYNKRVVSSTPVPTVVQLQRQQELQHKENLLQQQIQILQAQYENLQKEENGEGRQDSNSDIHSKQVRDGNSGDQRPRSARKSLEFPSNAEKPLIDNLDEQSSAVTTSSPREGNVEEGMEAEDAVKKVQFVKEDATNAEKPFEKSHLDLSEADDHDSLPCTSKLHSSKGFPPDITKQHGVGKEQCKKDTLKQSPRRNTDHLRILTYLVGELKAVLGTADVEVDRLLMEIENEIHLLSYTTQSSKTPPLLKQHDIDTEVALQPLRSENSDLRRKLRIMNQRLREMEIQYRKVPEKDQTRSRNEGLVESLHHQLLKERESVGKLRHEVELAEKRFAEYNKDKLNLQHISSEKEKDLHMLQEELKRQQGKNMTADTQGKLQLESIEITLNAKNKEVGLLNLALDQRDAEIGRLTELTRGLQESLTRVLSNVQELHPDDVISDVSMMSSVLDQRQPVGQGTVKSRTDVMASSNYRRQPWDDDFYDQMKQTEEYNKSREYDNRSEDLEQNSSLNDSTDDSAVTLSHSSADEFVFKKELANLDTVIARLQDSLRDKV